MQQLDALRQINVARCTAGFENGGFKLDDWSCLEWAGAMVGEAGEAANACKKLRRGDANASIADIADEIADTIIYCDLLAASLGIDLWLAIVDKFNKTSEKRGSPHVLNWNL